VYSLDSCRQMALANNKELMIKAERMRQAGYTRKEAFAAYLPAFDFTGGYTYNQKNISIFDSDQLLPVKNFNLQSQSYEFDIVKNPFTGEPVKGPDGQYVPSQVALIPKEAMEFDIHNVFFGAVTLTQPIFMGGKIVALNKLAGINEQAQQQLHRSEEQNVIYAVDAAYWTVVSLKAKHELAKSYVNLLDTLDRNVQLMMEQGVATRSDLLSVDVKLNEANVDLLKVENGLSLSRMALAQICGLPVHTAITVQDEGTTEINTTAEIANSYDMEQVYANRPDLHALELASRAAEQQQRVAMSDMLPNVALIGSYSFSNPNMFDGFKNRFNGAFSVGVMVRIPIWHWGGNYNKYRAAKSEHTILELQVENAKEMIDLQVSQAAFKAQEAIKTYMATETNLDKAKENLRTATLGFREGVITADDVMAAQTAWLKAHSENIDAMIDVE
ncbi:MAG: TolC family protein, partial [Muribaculaceae bacterium]|nr:TolC family protein [Muribaculaceae bacterium]